MWRRQKKQMKSILDIAQRTKRQVLSCYMSDMSNKHDMNERMTLVISNEEACHEGEATIDHKREGTNEKQTENVIETDCLGEELLEQCVRADDEAGSIALHVGHDMNEKEKGDEETDDAAAVKKMLESNEVISKEDVEIRRLIEERRTTPKEEKQRLKEVSKQIEKMHQGQKKNEKTGRDSTNT